jgi:hypothetical protein
MAPASTRRKFFAARLRPATSDSAAAASVFTTSTPVGWYVVHTPTLFNAGNFASGSCRRALTTVPDDLSGIYHAIHDNTATLVCGPKRLTPVRSLGAYIMAPKPQS